jgi:hypothetical protein
LSFASGNQVRRNVAEDHAAGGADAVKRAKADEAVATANI